MDLIMNQDKLVRAAIDTDELLTKEQTLRSKILKYQNSIPKLCDFPYLIDVEYLCFEKEKDDSKYKIRPGQGDLLFTNGNNQYVAVEIKSSYVCYNGSDRVQIAKTTKLIEQVYFYQDYQKNRLKQINDNAIVHGCGITEQKIYWITHDGAFHEFWWTNGPDESSLTKIPINDSINLSNNNDNIVDIEEIPDEYQELHELFIEESISRLYPFLIAYGNNRITYISKCKNRRIIVCKEHIAQKEIDEIKRKNIEDGYRNGQIMMFGEIRPTLISY